MYALCVCHSDLTRAVNALPQNMTSQMFSAIAAVTGQGQNPNTTPAGWASSQYGYTGGSSGGGGSSSAYHVRLEYTDAYCISECHNHKDFGLSSLSVFHISVQHEPLNFIFSAPGVCHTSSAAHCYSPSDAQLFIHHPHPQPAADYHHAPVPQQHSPVLTRITRTWTPPFLLHTIINILLPPPQDTNTKVSHLSKLTLRQNFPIEKLFQFGSFKWRDYGPCM